MVFTNLSERDKQAFFDLLDEYFESRPELLQSLGGGGETAPSSTLTPPVPLASAARKAFAANPDLIAGAASAARASLRSSANSAPPPPPSRSSAPTPAAAADDESEIETPSLGSVAARAAAFSAGGLNPGGAPSFRRSPSSTSSSAPSITDRNVTPGEARGLVQVKRFGDVDTSSSKNMYSTLRNSTANKKIAPTPVAPPPPPAFAPRRDFAPPPSRASAAARVPSPPPTPPPPEEDEAEEAAEEEEETGEWAEALYDYPAADSGDLTLKEGERVLVVERTSEDWWTGTLEDGARGLFPASYVKML